MDPNIISIFSNILLTIVTGIMAYATYKLANSTRESVNEMKITREESNSAEVTMYFEVEALRMYLIIENTGNTIANDVKIQSKPELKNSRDSTYTDLYDIPFLPPHHKIKTFFDMTNSYNNKKFPKGTFQISYKNIYNNTINRTYNYDLNYLNSTGYLNSETDTLEMSLNKMRKEIEKINSRLKDISKKL